VINDRRRVDLVMRVFKELVAAGATGVSPGAINTRLRELAEPMGTWEVRGALTALEADGEIVVDERSGAWFLADDSAKTQPLRDSA
jgi:DNA-binding FadR family transcriptional regulator